MKNFVVVAPSWIPQSGGITVLHKLANDLNLLGYNCYLAPSAPHGFTFHNPNYDFYTNSIYTNIKFITNEVYNDLDNSIVIYPEVWYGNFLNAKNVVRWILGKADPNYMKEGYFNGMYHSAWKDSDLWFWFNELYTTENFNSFNKNLDNILNVVEYHRNHFFNKNLERTINSWTLRKANGIITPSEYIHNKGDIFLGNVIKGINDFEFAGMYSELSNLLNISNRFYSYDIFTFLSVQAVMCGATSIVNKDKNVSYDDFKNGSKFNKFIAYGLDDIKNITPPDEIHDYIDILEKEEALSIHKFVEVCYDYFK